MPLRSMYDQADSGDPPPQPLKLELKHRSSAESGTMVAPSVAMQRRSEAASAVPKAQQQPQLDWSRMSPITLAHVGQLVSESNESGAWKPSGTLYSSKSPVARAA